jgi:hypothetical protein
VSDRLDSLAEQHPLSQALLAISESVRNTATLLAVLVATKITPISGSDSASFLSFSCRATGDHWILAAFVVRR